MEIIFVAPSPLPNTVEKPLLPPRVPLSTGAASPPPPLPQKPKKIRDTSLSIERPDGIRTFSRPKPLPNLEVDIEVVHSPPATNPGIFSTLIGRRSSNTPSSSPKIQHRSKDSVDGTLSSSHSVISSSDGLSSRSSSPDKDGNLYL